jgi:cobalt-zinc-cadmium efflux system outer membrane protein
LQYIFLMARRLAAALCIGAALASPVGAQPLAPAPAAVTPPTLRQALDAAWALSPQARAAPHRAAEWQARTSAAQSLWSGPPSLSLAHRSDRLNANGGLREYEAEVEVPLWNPGVRGATQRQVESEYAAFDHQQTLARLQLAGEVREHAAQLKLAQIELRLSERKQTDAEVLSGDVARRVKAGDLPRMDLAVAQAAVNQAAAVVAGAKAARTRAQSQWQALTGLSAPATPEAQSDPSGQHPAMLAAQTAVQAAQARLALAEADRRDPMAASLGLTREQSAFGAGATTQLRVALRIPLDTPHRNNPRLAAALADLATAQAEADQRARQTQGDQAAARAGADAARDALVQAKSRARLGAEVQTLVAKSFRLGESDLPARLRAENEKFDADMDHARAALALERAIAQLNQANGVMP